MYKPWEQKELQALQPLCRKSKIIRKALGTTSHLFPRAENVQSRQGISSCLNSFMVVLNTLGKESGTKLRMHWEINGKVFSFLFGRELKSPSWLWPEIYLPESPPTTGSYERVQKQDKHKDSSFDYIPKCQAAAQHVTETEVKNNMLSPSLYLLAQTEEKGKQIHERFLQV